jgi:hypothetical protein
MGVPLYQLSALKKENRKKKKGIRLSLEFEI